MSKLNVFENRPKLPSINVATYLRSLNLQNAPDPDLKFLKTLHRTHLLTFPFENLDIHWKKKIVLDIHNIYYKIILGTNRGGFCYELNGLFYHLLFHLGYDVTLISARVVRQDEEQVGAEYDHMAMMVSLNQKDYLVDVGFGAGFIYPKELIPDVVQMDFNQYFKLEMDANSKYKLLTSKNGVDYSCKYEFTTLSRTFIQFLDMCDYHQLSAESPFTKAKLITKATDTGRITLNEKELTIDHLGQTTVAPIINEDEFYSKLEQHFSIMRPTATN
jgi:N-hydroxyarylamine O-acetyltransferase